MAVGDSEPKTDGPSVLDDKSPVEICDISPTNELDGTAPKDKVDDWPSRSDVVIPCD